MPLMKKAFSILFLLVFLYNMAGFFVIFKVEQYSAKREMNAYINKNISLPEIEKVVISNAVINTGASGFRYLDDNKEFVFNGRLYDIAQSMNDGSNTVFYCINDKNEERLIAKFNEHLQRNNDQNVPGRNQTEKLVKGMVKEALPHNATGLFTLTESKIVFNENHQSLVKQYIPLFTPPPKA